MTFNKEMEKMKLQMQLEHMKHYSRLFGPDHVQKVEAACAALRQTQAIDIHVMAVAMTTVGCEGFIRLIDNYEELIVEIFKNDPNLKL